MDVNVFFTTASWTYRFVCVRYLYSDPPHTELIFCPYTIFPHIKDKWFTVISFIYFKDCDSVLYFFVIWKIKRILSFKIHNFILLFFYLFIPLLFYKKYFNNIYQVELFFWNYWRISSLKLKHKFFPSCISY